MKISLKIPENKTKRLNNRVTLSVEKGNNWSGFSTAYYQVEPNQIVELEIEDCYEKCFYDGNSELDGNRVFISITYQNSNLSRNEIIPIDLDNVYEIKKQDIIN